MLQALSDSPMVPAGDYSPLHAATIPGFVPAARELLERIIEFVKSSGRPPILVECIIDDVDLSGYRSATHRDCCDPAGNTCRGPQHLRQHSHPPDSRMGQ